MLNLRLKCTYSVSAAPQTSLGEHTAPLDPYLDLREHSHKKRDRMEGKEARKANLGEGEEEKRRHWASLFWKFIRNQNTERGIETVTETEMWNNAQRKITLQSTASVTRLIREKFATKRRQRLNVASLPPPPPSENDWNAKTTDASTRNLSNNCLVCLSPFVGRFIQFLSRSVAHDNFPPAAETTTTFY